LTDILFFQMRRFMIQVLQKQKVDISHCEQMADVLIEADMRGHYSHGLNRLEMYLRDCMKNVVRVKGTPKILKERACTAWVDGQNLLGPVVGNFCMDLAVKKAKEAGVGWVVAKGSNHFGICGWYVSRAMKHNVLGMAFTNTSPIMYPTRASVPALGTNPLCLGANGTGGDEYLLDMATTAVAIGKVEIYKRRGDKLPITWGVAKGGQTSTNPDEILAGGGLRPLGGTEMDGGYKGYGMGALVEIFCGILGGSHWGPHIRKWMSATSDADLVKAYLADAVFFSTQNVAVASQASFAHLVIYRRDTELLPNAIVSDAVQAPAFQRSIFVFMMMMRVSASLVADKPAASYIGRTTAL
uniref:Malate dehydrogenase n=1 Tax=Heligmosomoides polygyrus TaxID=6339 RepID=A0A8L8JVE3_HELPZ